MKHISVFRIKHLTLLLLTFLLSACTGSDSKKLWSYSENYSIFTSIENPMVIIHLLNKEGKEISVIDTRSSDVMKWAIGWMPSTDVVILYSSDIGSYAYTIENEHLIKLDTISKEMCFHANKLYEEKYSQTNPRDLKYCNSL